MKPLLILNGTYFFVELNYHNDIKIAEMLKANPPFKKFKSANGKMESDYERKRMINYTQRINQNDVEIFKQDNWVENTLVRIEAPINEPTINNDNKVKELLEADNFFEVEDGEMKVIGEDFNKVYINSAKAITLFQFLII